MVEVHYAGEEHLLCLYPARRSEDEEIRLVDALSRPDSIYQELEQDPQLRFPIRAYSGWPELIIVIGEAVLTGVAGNAAYDALKASISACDDALSRMGERGHQHLSEGDAANLARAFVRAWEDEPGRRIRLVQASLSRSNKWVVTLRTAETVYDIGIPPGPIVGAKVRVKRRDGRSVLRRIRDQLAWRWQDIRYRFW